ncbi:hypothetical protein L204_104077 [Cryptococcus depauperatus]
MSEKTTVITATAQIDLPAHPTKKSYAELNPFSRPTEFFGPWGTAAITLCTPVLAYLIFFACNDVAGCAPTSLRSVWRLVGDYPDAAGKLWEWKAAGVYVGWYVFCIVCELVLPGERIQGNLLRDGSRKTYRMNGESVALALTDGVPGALRRLLGCTTISCRSCLRVWRWRSSRRVGCMRGATFQFFLGRPLNPTFPKFPTFDIKTFNEVRPGMILWLLLNISCACEQYTRLGKLTDSMWIVLASQGWYVLDCLLQEHTILNQMDITTDGFGFMLAFGDLTWVPFTYGLQARFLAFNPVTLGPVATALVVGVEVAGMWIFRVANNEKANFRAGKNPKNLEFMQTDRGTKLLTSGWWGRSRHPNYFGDWLIALGWCLPTGFHTPLTYFYLIYFIVLLVHRQARDEEACRQKYGDKDWDRYCAKVKWKIVPIEHLVQTQPNKLLNGTR